MELTNPALDTRQVSLPNFFLCVLIFSVFLLPISLMYFMDIHLQVFSVREFVFHEFLVYTYAIKLIAYFFKFFFISLIFYLGAFLFNVGELKFTDVLKASFLAEIVKVFVDLIAVIYFSLNPLKLTSVNVKGFEDNFTLNGLAGLTDEHFLYQYFDIFGVFDILYILVIAKIMNSLTSESYGRTVLWTGITYLLAMVVIALVKTLISF